MNRKRAPRLSLDLLRGFRSAARHLSFTRAAQDLFVTQSAISREIKTLEEQLGQPLFRRVNRTLQLTPPAKGCIALLTRRLRSWTPRSSVLREPASCGGHDHPAFASLWLAPRLQRFNRAHPGIDVRVVASNDKPNLERDQLDIAIRFVLAGDDFPIANLFRMQDFSRLFAGACEQQAASDPNARRPGASRQARLRKCARRAAVVLMGLLVRQDEDPARETREYAAFLQYDQLVSAAIEGSIVGSACCRISAVSSPESLVRSVRDGGSGATRRFLHHPPVRCCWTRRGRGVRRLALSEVRRDAELAPAPVRAADGARQRASHAAFQKSEALGKRFERVADTQRCAPRMACTQSRRRT